MSGQVDEEKTEAKKGVQTENELPNWWVSLERRMGTQQGGAQPSGHGRSAR